MMFPVERPRRLRGTPALRNLVRETVLTPHDFVLPLFAVEGKGEGYREPIRSMPGCFHLSPEMAAREAKEAFEAGVQGVILFGLPARKDPMGSGAFAEDGIVQQAVRAVKAAVPGMCVMCDVCLCEYTDHGHCGLLEGETVCNDATLPVLAATAVSQARAGADVIAPSDMMDGRVLAIRRALDESGFSHVPVMAYAAKFASAFYGPFREAADSAPAFGDRSTYQMDPANGREAVREMTLDDAEGADILMVKPAMPYLDLVAEARRRFQKPVAAYQVSGEYAMIKAAAAAGLLDEERAMMESLVAIKRAGADIILTYFAVAASRVIARKWGGR